MFIKYAFAFTISMLVGCSSGNILESPDFDSYEEVLEFCKRLHAIEGQDQGKIIDQTDPTYMDSNIQEMPDINACMEEFWPPSSSPD